MSACVLGFQKEEEKRRQEERRKAEEERQKLEKDRKDREAKETAQRDKRDKERASEIEAQKWVQQKERQGGLAGIHRFLHHLNGRFSDRKYQQKLEAESREQEKQRWVSVPLSHSLFLLTCYLRL